MIHFAHVQFEWAALGSFPLAPLLNGHELQRRTSGGKLQHIQLSELQGVQPCVLFC